MQVDQLSSKYHNQSIQAQRNQKNFWDARDNIGQYVLQIRNLESSIENHLRHIGKVESLYEEAVINSQK